MAVRNSGTAKTYDELNEDEGRNTPFFDPWEDPPPAEFPGGVFSRQVEDTIFALALRGGFCPGVLGMAHLAAISGAAHKGSRFQPYGEDPTFIVPPVIWVMAVVPSGERKTSIKSIAFASIGKIDAETWRTYFAELRRWRAVPKPERKETDQPVEPVPISVQDITIEKLQCCLANTDRGLLYLKDEIAGLFEFGRYSDGKGAMERGFFLEAFDGGSYTALRMSRDPVVIGNNAITIFGVIQDRRLKDFPGLDKDGFIQRMSMVRGSAAGLSRPDIIARGYDELQQAITALTKAARGHFTTTREGESLIRETETYAQQLAKLQEISEGFSEWLKKMHGAQARYALLLHLLDGAQDAIIPLATIKRAGILVHEFLLPNARDFFGFLPGVPPQRIRDIASWIITSDLERFRAADIKHHVWSCRGLSTKELNDALDPLLTGEWLRPETDFPTNRAWFVNPGLRLYFSERAEKERERRAEIRAMLQNIGKKRR